jgi:ABC-2 type transport system ATP-binding protein
VQTPAVFIDRLNKFYKDNWVIKNLSLEVPPGEVFALVGPNGAGKTTIIRILMGLSSPSDGIVRVLGLNPRKQTLQLRSNTGYVMQQIALDPYLTGRENLDIFCDLFNLPSKQKAQRINKLLGWAKLSDAADRLVRTYSGGMKRQMNLLIGLLHDPDLLFLDEPTLGLDVQARRQLWTLIADIKKQGTTIILTTHYLEEANALCDSVVVIVNGNLAALGSPERLKTEIANDLHQLKVSFDMLPSLEKLSLPVTPTISNNQLHFMGSHEILWRTLSQLQNEFGDQVRDISYLQPSLDDVVMKISESIN